MPVLVRLLSRWPIWALLAIAAPAQASSWDEFDRRLDPSVTPQSYTEPSASTAYSDESAYPGVATRRGDHNAYSPTVRLVPMGESYEIGAGIKITFPF